MKILILTCFTGEGHNSAAKAVAEELAKHSVEYEIVDPTSFKGQISQHLTSTFYNNLIKKAPSMFGAIYKIGTWYDNTEFTSPIYLANSIYAEKLYNYIKDNHFDAVISSHLYGMEALTAIKKRISKDIPFYGILTDYTVVPFFTELVLDGYFVPCNDVVDKLIQRGLPREAIHVTGIPISDKFNFTLTREEAKEHIGISSDKKLFVIMSGGIGGGNVQGLCDSLYTQTDSDSIIYVLTGHNEKLFAEINAKYANKVKAVSFTKEVNYYMKAADVLLSKPGGLSSTEAAVINVPLVHINAIPGCETANIEFFGKNGLSIPAKNNDEAARFAVELSNDKVRSERICTNQRITINPYAARDIVQIMTKT